MREETIYWFYHPERVLKFLQHLNEVNKNAKRLDLKCIPFLLNGPLAKVFKNELYPKVILQSEKLPSKEKLFRLSIKRRDKHLRGIFLQYPDLKDLYLFFTLDNMNTLRSMLKHYFNRVHPTLSRIFLKSRFIHTILKDLEPRISGDIISERVVAKRIYGKKVSEIRFEEQPFEEAFRIAAESNLWIDTIWFKVSENWKEALHDDEVRERVNLKGFISRDGIFKTSGGPFQPLYDTIKQIGKNEMQKKDRYSNRARVKENNYKSNPITIEFDKKVFKSKKEIKRFISTTLDEKTFSTISISHLNPYLEASFLDQKDGSTYDIWITDSDQMTIIPQLRATFASVYGLVSHIFENFREGTVRDGK